MSNVGEMGEDKDDCVRLTRVKLVTGSNTVSGFLILFLSIH
jgi:hypothetical protein